MDRDNLWTRRTNTKSSYQKAEGNTRNAGQKRYTSGDHSSRSNGLPPINTTNTVSSPGTSSAFGLGSGAFAAFGASSKTPRTAGSTLEFAKGTSSSDSPAADNERQQKSGTKLSSQTASKEQYTSATHFKTWPTKHTWVMWYRPPAQSKSQDYEKSIKPVYKMATAQDFWKVYSHLKRPSALPVVSDYHLFKDGIRPVWEDEANKKGGKWIMRFKKGVMDRYWDELLLAVVGDQFAEAGEEVCGVVVSVRNGEDVLSVWTRNDGGRNVRIRETIKTVLSLPPDTIMIWKSHDDSIAQKSAVDEARKDKVGTDKRRGTFGESSGAGKDKSAVT